MHRVLAAVTTDPAQMFGSSGGAVTGLALAIRHPGQVRTLVAHEPPLAELLPDRARVRSGVDEIDRIYRSEGQGAAWQKYLALAGFDVPASRAAAGPSRPAPPSAQELANGRRMFEHCLRQITFYRPDLPALRAGSTRIVVGGGQASAGQRPYRAAAALAGQLGTPLAEFPGGHATFAAEPEPFARTLRRVLTEAASAPAGA